MRQERSQASSCCRERATQTEQSGGIIEVVHDIDQVGGADAELLALDSLLKLVGPRRGALWCDAGWRCPAGSPAVSFAQTTRISHSWTSPWKTGTAPSRLTPIVPSLVALGALTGRRRHPCSLPADQPLDERHCHHLAAEAVPLGD